MTLYVIVSLIYLKDDDLVYIFNIIISLFPQLYTFYPSSLNKVLNYLN